MADDNSGDSSRKKARAQKAKKRDDDVLNTDTDGDEKVRRVDKTATARGGDDSSGEPSTSDPPQDSPQQSGSEPSDPEEFETIGSPLDRGEAWLEQLFERMNLDLDASGRRDDQNLVFDITGEDADDLIGRSRRSPKLLSAMQTLLAEHLGDDTREGVLIDVGGFKQKRQQQLTGVADRLGETVNNIGKSLTVAGLDKHERRMIHQRLKNVRGVDTESVGQGQFRKLRVLKT